MVFSILAAVSITSSSFVSCLVNSMIVFFMPPQRTSIITGKLGAVYPVFFFFSQKQAVDIALLLLLLWSSSSLLLLLLLLLLLSLLSSSSLKLVRVLARPYLMTLCVIFPIHVNFAITSRCVLKAPTHKKTELFCVTRGFFSKRRFYDIVYACCMWLILLFYYSLFLIFMYLSFIH